jgi:hypothetical protein
MPAFRPDRIATLYLFHPLQRLSRRTAAGIPILMHHSIADLTADESFCASPPRPTLEILLSCGPECAKQPAVSGSPKCYA